MNRSYVVTSFLEHFPEALFVSCNGFTSRELFQADDHRNFYMLGSMGLATSIGIGVAAASSKLVVVLEGDGNVIMLPSSLSAASSMNVKNLVVVVLNNHVYESTGGQARPHMDFTHLGLSCGLAANRIFSCPDKSSLAETLRLLPEPIAGPALIICQTEAESPAPRVALSPPDISDCFMTKINMQR